MSAPRTSDEEIIQAEAPAVASAENVLEIQDAQVAERMAAFVDRVRARYPRAPSPQGKP